MSKLPRHFFPLLPLISALMITACIPVRAAGEAKGANSLPPVFVQALKKAGIPESAVAVDVRRAISGDTVIAHNNQAIFRPASIMKLVTTQAALEFLGPNHRWITRLHIDGVQRGDVLQGGDLVRLGAMSRAMLDALSSAVVARK